MKKSHREFHEDAVMYYIQKFREFNATTDKNEKYGDFHIQVNGGIIGFEVYAPEEPLAVSTKKIKDDTVKVKTIGSKKYGFMGGGLDPNRLNQLIERALEVKAHQFTNKTMWPKILLICCKYPGAFSSLDNFLSEYDNHINNELFRQHAFCSAIFIDGSFKRTITLNPHAKYPMIEVAKLSKIFRYSNTVD